MAIIRKSELKVIKVEEASNKLVELKKELMKYNAQIAIGTVPENAGKIREIKKTIARLNNKIMEAEKKR
ncbi:50S ribosomal protein L29 [Candidatus Woesearchaeota archaeon]|nr:50S ribosomal protein L29 [Candidatus Woesearchaeota archaeon]